MIKPVHRAGMFCDIVDVGPVNMTGKREVMKKE